MHVVGAIKGLSMVAAVAVTSYWIGGLYLMIAANSALFVWTVVTGWRDFKRFTAERELASHRQYTTSLSHPSAPRRLRSL